MKCRICNNEDNNLRFDIREMMFSTRLEFSYFQCGQCKCLQISEIPLDMKNFYPPNYYSFNSSPVSEPAVFSKQHAIGLLKRERDRYASLRQGFLGKIANFVSPESIFDVRSLGVINVTQHTRILDVGCGSGHLLRRLKNVGFQNISGIDPYNDQDINEPGLDILNRDLSEVSGTWDVIMLHHVFEHLDDPQEKLRLIFDRLSPSGTCIIRIPTVSSWAWRHYQENWFAIDAPRHFFLHSIESMKILAMETNFSIDKIVYDSNFWQIRGSEFYKRDVAPSEEGNFSDRAKFCSSSAVRRMKRQATRLNNANQGDQACFFLKKNT